mgnify:CR=1 FL=1
MTETRGDEQDIVAFMQSIAGQQPEGRVALDVGAGAGQSSQPYAQVGWSVISADVAMEALRSGLTDGRIQPGRAVFADGRRLPFRDAAFHLVSSRWFLHEFPDQVPFLREMRRVVHDDGVVVAVDFAAPSRASQEFLNRYVLADEYVRAWTELVVPWADAGMRVDRLERHHRRMEKDEAIRAVACGSGTGALKEVKRELHITCDERQVFLRIPVAFLVARRA